MVKSASSAQQTHTSFSSTRMLLPDSAECLARMPLRSNSESVRKASGTVSELSLSQRSQQVIEPGRHLDSTLHSSRQLFARQLSRDFLDNLRRHFTSSQIVQRGEGSASRRSRK